MGFKVKARNGGGEGDFAPCPEGAWPAVLVGLFDVGTHTEAGFNGAPDEDVRKVVLVWEVHTDAREEPWIVLRDYRLSFHEKSALRKLVEGWRGQAFREDEEFDLSAVAGKPALVQIVHKQAKTSGNTYGRLDTVMKLPKQVPAPKPVHPILSWSVDDGTALPRLDYDAFLRGEPLAEYIQKAKELKPPTGGMGSGKAAATAAVTDGNGDEAPF